MIDYQVLRSLILEALKIKPQTSYHGIMIAVGELAARHNVFPSEEECRKRQVDYRDYKERRLNPIDLMNVNQIIWDLVVERILTIGYNTSNDEWPNLRLTIFGHSVVNQPTPHYYDPAGYLATLDSFAPNLDRVIKQYVWDGLNAFRQRLFFAAAVMFGAAAEKAVLLLLKSIGDAETDTKKRKDIEKLLENPRLPTIFSKIESRISELIKAKKIPYSVHQGSTEHLLSLFEMIRVQRNDAVHPAAGQVNQTKVFLTIQSLPVVLEVVFRLIEWFSNNPI